jgi:hypothetical protein
MTLNVTPGTFSGHMSPGISVWGVSSVPSEEIEARSNGARSSWESQSNVMYLSSHCHASDDSSFSTGPASVPPALWGRAIALESPVSMADSNNSRYLVSVLKNRTMTFSPLILQNVYRSLQIALERGISSCVCDMGSLIGGARRCARKASARTGTSLSR